MGPVGNTGETLTGLFVALTQGRRPIAEAAVMVATSNRLMGLLCRPRAAFSEYDLLQRLEDAMVQVLKGTRKEG
jgi:NAD(P)H-hydrate repair Nnr-like enzyme with NAD(P)H-hydrate dehydratase domain